MMLRALWIWQRWIGVWRPKLRRIALESAFEPSMMNNRGTAGSSPRSTRSSINACTTAACSVAPSISPSGCLTPSPSIPIAATSTKCSLMWMPSICTTMMSRPERSAPIHSFMRAADSATKCREAADFDTPAPAGAGTSPSGSRTARRNFRVETLISIRFIAHLTEPVLLDRPLPARQRQLLAGQVAHPRPLDLHLAGVEPDLALGSAPAVSAPAFAASMARPTSLLCVLLHHGAQRLDPGCQAEPIEACRHLVPRLAHSPQTRRQAKTSQLC